MKTEIIFKYYMEPYNIHGDVWVMKPKLNNLETIVCCSYSGCYEQAKKQIEGIFKFVKP
jgi:hypothetical protein